MGKKIHQGQLNSGNVIKTNLPGKLETVSLIHLA